MKITAAQYCCLIKELYIFGRHVCREFRKFSLGEIVFHIRCPHNLIDSDSLQGSRKIIQQPAIVGKLLVNFGNGIEKPRGIAACKKP